MLRNGSVATRLPAQDLERARRSTPRSSGSSPSRSGRAVCGTCARAASSRCSSPRAPPSGDHTQMGWEVDDIEATVASCGPRGRLRGVRPSRPETVDGIADIEGNYPSKGTGERGAWFRDSEGNMLGIGQPLRA